jgi:hypothetical protein
VPPDRRASLFEKASVIKDHNRITLGRQFQHLLNSLAIERIGIPLHGCQQALELLLTRTRNYSREGITVLVRMVSQQAGQIALQRDAVFVTPKLALEWLQKVHQFS